MRDHNVYFTEKQETLSLIIPVTLYIWSTVKTATLVRKLVLVHLFPY